MLDISTVTSNPYIVVPSSLIIGWAAKILVSYWQHREDEAKQQVTLVQQQSQLRDADIRHFDERYMQIKAFELAHNALTSRVTAVEGAIITIRDIFPAMHRDNQIVQTRIADQQIETQKQIAVVNGKVERILGKLEGVPTKDTD